jgi:restriction system protein
MLIELVSLAEEKLGTNGVLLISGLIVVALAGGVRYWFLQREKQLRALRLADGDNMDPYDFERCGGRLLEQQGYGVRVMGKAGDLGVDIVAKTQGVKYAVQVKRYTKPVSQRAVSDAVAGKAHYGCNAAMVVTNSSFTEGAMTLARSTSCELIDRERLASWILSFRQGKRFLGNVCPFCRGQTRDQVLFCGHCGKPFIAD